VSLKQADADWLMAEKHRMIDAAGEDKELQTWKIFISENH